MAQEGDKNSVPENADLTDVPRAIVKGVNTPFSKHPFRVTVDPAGGGADEMNKLRDRIRADYLKTAGMGDLLRPYARASLAHQDNHSRETITAGKMIAVVK